MGGKEMIKQIKIMFNRVNSPEYVLTPFGNVFKIN